MVKNKADFAKVVAAFAHEGQIDKAGEPYIFHPMTVAKNVEGDDAKCVAYLHDVLEDTFVDEHTIRNLFGDVIGDAVVALTRKPGEDYFTYIDRISRNTIARTVKLSDLRHNMDLSRLQEVTQKDLDRVKKYQKAMEILKEKQNA